MHIWANAFLNHLGMKKIDPPKKGLPVNGATRELAGWWMFMENAEANG